MALNKFDVSKIVVSFIAIIILFWTFWLEIRIFPLLHFESIIANGEDPVFIALQENTMVIGLFGEIVIFLGAVFLLLQIITIIQNSRK